MSDEKPDDDNGHGTRVASIICSMIDYLGLEDYIKIMPIKALNSDGSCKTENICDGIIYAINNGVQVVNLSIETNIDDIKLRNAIQFAEEKNVVIVASAGNKLSNLSFPAAYDSVLSVGGITTDKKKDPITNYGSNLDVVAPSKLYTLTLKGKWRYHNGSSISAPQVSIASALVFLYSPSISSRYVRDIITTTTEDIGLNGWDEKFGFGILRIDKILAVLENSQ